MNEDRNQDRHPRQQATIKHPDDRHPDLNPNYLAGQNIGVASDIETRGDRTAFNIRKQGWKLGNLDDNELEGNSGDCRGESTPARRYLCRPDC
jgi:hypothetical protein